LCRTFLLPQKLLRYSDLFSSRFSLGINASALAAKHQKFWNATGHKVANGNILSGVTPISGWDGCYQPLELQWFARFSADAWNNITFTGPVK